MIATTEAPTRVRRSIGAVVGTRPATLSVDLALVAVRVALAWIFAYYGGGKLFGWFGGAGIHGTSLFFERTAHLRPGGFFAVLAGVLELGAAVALVLGVGSRLAAVALVGDMAMAMLTVTWANGLHNVTGRSGYELNLALGALALVVVAMGAGRFSVDALAERTIRRP